MNIKNNNNMSTLKKIEAVKKINTEINSIEFICDIIGT